MRLAGGRAAASRIALVLATGLAAAIATVPALTTQAVAATATATAELRVVTYPGLGAAVHTGQLGPLDATSSEFASFIDARLRRIRHGITASCKGAAVVTVKRWRSDGYAVGLEGVDQNFDGGACGGYGRATIYEHFDRGWRVLLSDVDSPGSPPYCFEYALARVPFDITTTQDTPEGCMSDTDNGIRYRNYVFNRKVFFTAQHSFETAVADVDTDTMPWIDETTSGRLWQIWNGAVSDPRRPTLSRGGCFSPSDPTYGYLLAAKQEGCLLYVRHAVLDGDIFVMKMEPRESDSVFASGHFDLGMWQGVALVRVGTFPAGSPAPISPPAPPTPAPPITPGAPGAPTFKIDLQDVRHPRKPIAGRVVRFEGAVTPRRSYAPVLVEVDSGSGWMTVARPRLSLTSTYSTEWRIPGGGTYRFRVVKPAAGGVQEGVSATLSLTTAGKLAISDQPLADGVVGAPYQESVGFTGGMAPVTLTASGLPPGLTMDSAGTISGTPTTKSATVVTVTATDAIGQTVTALLPWTSNRRPGSVYGWGESSHGALGLPVAKGTVTLPAQLNLARITEVSGGDSASYAVDTHGHVWAWGRPYRGREVAVRVRGLSRIVEVAPGSAASYALDSAGHVWAWGNGPEGELGDGAATRKSSTPVRVAGLSGITQVAAGTLDGYALDSTGHIWAWGDGWNGALGDGTGRSSDVPVRVKGLSDAAQISAVDDYASALDAHGHVWSWGDGDAGELGDGSTKTSNVPVRVSGLSGITQVSGSTALDGQGHVWDWGWALDGELGIGIPLKKEYDVPMEVSGLSGITQIATGHALDSQGRVWSWGFGRDGTLGNGTRREADVPVQVLGLSGIAQISVGNGTTFAVQGPLG